MGQPVLTFTTPDGTISQEVRPDNASFGQRISEPSTLICEFHSNWDDFLDESDPTNYGQVGAFGRLVEDGVTIFEGTIKDKILRELENGEQILEITLYDKLHNLKDCLAVSGSKSIFSSITPAVSLDEVALVAGETQEDAQFPYFVNTSSAIWLPISGGNETNNTTLDADYASGSTADLVFTTDYVGLLPRGYLAVVSTGGTEYIYYDGMDDATSGDKWTAYNIVRGALGSIAVNHDAATATVHQWISKKIHPDDPVIMEAFNVDDNDWEALPKGWYGLQIEEGRIDMGFDIFAIFDGKTGNLKYHAGHTPPLRVSMAYFDELSGDAVLLDTEITNVLTTSNDNLGTGLSAGDINVDIDETRLTRIYNKKPTKVLAYLDSILGAAELSGGDYVDPVGYWYDHNSSKVTVKTVNQGDPSFFFPSMQEIEFDKSSEMVYTAVRVAYNLGTNTNLAAPTRCWHPQVGDVIGGEAVTHMWYQDEEEDNATGWKQETTVGHNLFTERLVDSFKNTGMGINFNGTPSVDVDVVYCWFDDALNNYVVDEITVVLDPRRESVEGAEFEVQVMGITGFNKTTPASSSSFFTLHSGLYVRYPDGDLSATREVTIQAKDIGKGAEGIAIRFKGLSSDKGSFRYGRIKEIKVVGDIIRTANVRLSNSSSTTSGDLYYPAVYNKLVSSISKFNQFKTLDIDIGAGSYNSAVSLGRLALLQSLATTIEKTFVIESETIGGIPTVGDTVQFGSDEADTGIVTKVAYNMNTQGEKLLILTIIDFSTDILGGDLDI